MPLPVFLSARAHQDVDDSYGWWAKNRSAEQARRWRDLCVQTIDSLPEKAASAPFAAENGRLPIEIKQINFGLKRRPTHRIIFTIRPDMILVLRVHHLAQDELTLDDL